MMIELVKNIATGKGPSAAANKITNWNTQWGREEESWQRNIPFALVL
jgi:hypothetical protein